jgi:periplasmic protein TonB
MTGGPIHRMDVAGPRAPADAGDLSDVVPSAGRETASPAPPISATNVIPFVRSRRDAAPANSAADITFDPAARPAPLLIARERRIQIAALLALSLGVHAGLYVLFNRDPEPMVSIGLEAISVEIMLGANMPAGPAPTPAEPVRSAPVEDPKPKPVEPDATAKVDETKPPDATPVEQPQRLAQSAVTEVAPDRPRPQATETPPQRPDQPQREPELSAAPQEPTKVAPAEPDQPEPIRTETRQPPQPKAAPKPEPKKKETRPAPQQKTASREPATTARTPPSSAGGVGAGRSQLDSNYRGIVFAHLARQKRYPAEAAGAQGRAMVNFSLDGSGRVTRVSLVGRAGHAALDQEATAMVRRASPFPAPPDGRGRSFTVPVRFNIR